MSTLDASTIQAQSDGVSTRQLLRSTVPAHVASATPAEHRPGTSGYRRVVIALFAAGLATFALLYSTQAILPELRDAFGVSSAASTLTVSLTTLGLSVALLLAGPLSDRFGRTFLIHFSITAAGLVGLACALAPSWPTLIALRLLLGVSLAGLPAVATAYLREELHASSHARAAGLYIGGTALGGMAGRLVTGGVAELAGWRWALAATALLALGCAVVVRSLLPSSSNFRPTSAGLRPLLDQTRRALADPALLALYGIGALSMGTLVAVFNTLSFRLVGAPYHLGLGAVSLVFLVYPVGTLSSVLFGRLADVRGRRAVVPLGCLLALVGVVLTLASPLPVVVLGLAVLIAGFFAVHGVASGWVPVRAHAGGVAAGQAASLYLFAYYLGSSVFGGLAGQVWSSHGWTGVVVLATVMLLITAALSLVLRRLPALAPTG